MKVLVTPTSFNKVSNPEAVRLLESMVEEIIYNPYGRPLLSHEIIALAKGVDAYIAGLDYINGEAIEALANEGVKVISRYGAGVDRVDLEAASEHGIMVTNTPGVNAQAVADLTIALMLAVARKIPAMDHQVRDGKWPRENGTELYKKTLGIIGLGAIGKGVALRGKGFSMDVKVYDPYVDRDFTDVHDIEVTDFISLIKESDFISLHLPLTEHTKGIIGYEAMNEMKDTAIIINTARGGLIDETAAYEALVNNTIGGLGLDAFQVEPPEASPLFELDNVVVTPHMGAKTKEAVINMGLAAVENVRQVFAGEECTCAVKPRRNEKIG